MKLYIIIGATLLGLAGVAYAQDHRDAVAGAFKDESSKASYAFGMNIGRGWKTRQVDLDPDAAARGLKDSLAGPTLLTEAEMNDALAKFGQPPKAREHPASEETIGEGCRQGAPRDGAGSNRFKNERDRVSYAFGMDIGLGWKAGQIELDPETVLRGLKDSLASRVTLLSKKEMDDALARFGRELSLAQQRHRDEVAEENRRSGSIFLAQNGARAGVITSTSGLQYEVIATGAGASPALGNWVKLKYRGMRIDGKVFESSEAHPEASLFGLGAITAGWAEALQLMKVGDRWRLFVPPSLAFGKDGAPGVGPNETLIYDLELVSILPGQPQPTAEDLQNERATDGD